MNIPKVTFSDKKPEFYRVVKERVNNYFRENEISKHANFEMMLKSVIMISLYAFPFALMLTGIVSSNAAVLGMWAIMGFGMAGIGLCVMHDANHGAYSNNQKVNTALGFMLTFIGGYRLNWIIQHNVLHHSYANVEGLDEDIHQKGVMRFSPKQGRKGFFKYQIIYAPFLYGLLTLVWYLFKDFAKLVRYNKLGLLEAQGKTFKRALAEVVFHKTWYTLLFIVLPISIIDLPWWVTIIGYVVMQFICGLFLSLIFSSGHVVEEAEFYHAIENSSLENNWAIHQMQTTSNFGNKSRWFTWFIGGLNHQIEHHLFPQVCHVHYPALKAIVKKTAHEFNVPYHEHKSWYDALKSHFTLLNNLGTGKKEHLESITKHKNYSLP